MSYYAKVKRWREKNPTYNRDWMRKKRGSKLAKIIKVDDLSDLKPIKDNVWQESM